MSRNFWIKYSIITLYYTMYMCYTIILYYNEYQRRQWQPNPVFLPGESQGQRSLVGCRLCDRKESDITDTTWQQHDKYRI